MGDEQRGDLTPGAMLTPSLRLVRPLGAGGMGRVWVAHHTGLRADVAVKLISADLIKNEDALERFSREAAAASQVRSPHVVQTLDYGVTDKGIPFIAMELLEGRDLASLIAEHGPLDPSDVSKIVLQVARALTRAHERQIVHRDIKPENIFLTDAGGGDLFAKVLDFGVAKAPLDAASRATGTGMMLGTPVYMSPEQVKGEKTIDWRSDVWSLGVVAFEALIGVVPFEGETVGALSIAICHDPLPVPSSVSPALGKYVDRWFLRACARDVSLRFQAAMELAIGLERALAADRVRADSAMEDALEETIIVESTDRESLLGAAPKTPPSDVDVPDDNEATLVRETSTFEPPTRAPRLTPAHLSGATTIPNAPRVTTGSASSVATPVPTGRATERRRRFAVGVVVAATSAIALVVAITRSSSRDDGDESERPRRTRATLHVDDADDGERPRRGRDAAVIAPNASTIGETGASAPSASVSASTSSIPRRDPISRPSVVAPTKPTAAPSARKKKGWILE
ncbi:MAG: serine/threonine-protein kinase [Polyangiales bacterium]